MSRWAAPTAGPPGPPLELKRIAADEPERFEDVPGVGATVAAGLVRYFTDPATQDVLAELVAAGVEAERPVVRAAAAGAAGRGPLAGKTLVVTGTLAGFDRQGAEDAIRAGRWQGLRARSRRRRLPGRRRERRLEAGQGPGARRAGPRRGRRSGGSSPVNRRYDRAMATLSRADVAHVAHLARLGLTDAELARLEGELNHILDQYARLTELDTDAIAPTAQTIELENILRDDVVRPSLDQAAALANAPETSDGFIVVAAVLGGD